MQQPKIERMSMFFKGRESGCHGSIIYSMQIYQGCRMYGHLIHLLIVLI